MKNLPTQYPFEAYADTRIGGRTENQDTYSSVDTPYGMLVLVCDGMGGGPSGKAASMLAAKAITQYVMQAAGQEDRIQLLSDAIHFANGALLEAVRNNPASRGMGTTVTALLINEISAVVAHVGDSRVYQFRRKRKVYRTIDHSLVFERVRLKQMTEEEARTADNSNIITQAVGSANGVRPDVVELPYEKGDRFMLCSDGIWGAFPEPEIIKMAASPKSLAGAVDGLVVRVDEHGFSEGGHHDNLTAAMLQTKNTSILKEKMSTKQRNLFGAVSALLLTSLIANVILLSRIRHLTGASDAETETEQPTTPEQEATTVVEMKVELATAVSDESEEVATRELSSSLADIIQELESIQALAAGTEKDGKVDAVKGQLEAMTEDLVAAGAPMADVQEVIRLLGNSIAKREGDRTAGHYRAIIEKVKAINKTVAQ